MPSSFKRRTLAQSWFLNSISTPAAGCPTPKTAAMNQRFSKQGAHIPPTKTGIGMFLSAKPIRSRISSVRRCDLHTVKPGLHIKRSTGRKEWIKVRSPAPQSPPAIAVGCHLDQPPNANGPSDLTTRPARMLIRVHFPAPFGPRSPNIDPRGMLRSCL